MSKGYRISLDALGALLVAVFFFGLISYHLASVQTDRVLIVSFLLALLGVGYVIIRLMKDNAQLSRLQEQKPVQNESAIASSVESQQSEIERADQDMDKLVMRSRYVVMGEMIAMISHQWRQPLAASMLNVEILTTKIKMLTMSEQDKAFLQSRLSLLRDMLMEKSHLIGEFTDFFNPDRELTWFKVLSTVNSVLLMFESNITNDGIKIHRSINVNCEIFGIEREFKQMILNIVKNAIDQLTDSGVEAPYISISVSKSEEESGIIVEIRDNAGGIPEAVLPRIFEAYVSTKSLNGAGLGLYMVKIIVLEHFGGTIQAYNSEVGAVFRIFIPQKI